MAPNSVFLLFREWTRLPDVKAFALVTLLCLISACSAEQFSGKGLRSSDSVAEEDGEDLGEFTSPDTPAVVAGIPLTMDNAAALCDVEETASGFTVYLCVAVAMVEGRPQQVSGLAGGLSIAWQIGTGDAAECTTHSSGLAFQCVGNKTFMRRLVSARPPSA